MSRVYISPSTQEANIGLGNYGSEEKRMNEIADYLIPILHDHGITCFRNTPQMSAVGCKEASNIIGVDAHIAIHSNAGGGQGTSAFTSGSLKGRKLAQFVYDEVAAITPAEPDRGVRTTTTFVEVVKTNAPAVLIEVSFHDHWRDATWIIQNQKEIAIAIAKGILLYFNKTYIRLPDVLLPETAPLSPFNPAPSGYKWMLIRE